MDEDTPVIYTAPVAELSEAQSQQAYALLQEAAEVELDLRRAYFNDAEHINIDSLVALGLARWMSLHELFRVIDSIMDLALESEEVDLSDARLRAATLVRVHESIMDQILDFYKYSYEFTSTLSQAGVSQAIEPFAKDWIKRETESADTEKADTDKDPSV